VELVILEELKRELPPLTDEERATLESVLVEEGIRDKLRVWKKDGQTILVDGHNRYEVAKKHNLPFEVSFEEFADIEEAKFKMRNWNHARRNLTDGWKAELAIRNKAYLLEKGKEREKKGGNAFKGNQYTQQKKENVTLEGLSESDKPSNVNSNLPEKEEKHNTQTELAKELGWSTGKVAKAEYVRKNNPTNWEKTKAGEFSVDKAYRETKEEEKKQEPVRTKSESTNQDGAKQSKPTLKKFNQANENIGWAGWSWNPVTGCKHNCSYCYAREIAMRFEGNFEPRIREERLEAPGHTKPDPEKPGGSRVFVCSMADLFGTWVPNDWIYKVLRQVEAHPEWTFMFLTKNPRRYESLEFPDNAWIGATVDTQARVKPTEDAMANSHAKIKFVSCEPLLESVVFERPELFDWFLVGAKSEGAKKVQPETKWTLDIITQAHLAGKKVWMKDNLALVQESPEVVK